MADAPAPPTTDPTTPNPTPAPKPGWSTSEAWVSLLVVVIGAIPSTGLTDNSPLLAKIVGMAIAALAAMHYTAQRSALKRAYVATAASPSSSKVQQIVAGASVIALVAALGIISGQGCSGSMQPIVTGGKAFLDCGKQDLTQIVGDKTLLVTVAGDLLDKNYQDAISTLIGRVGNDAVGCATIAVDAVLGASGNGVTPHTITTQQARARELIAKYNWASSSGK